MSGKNIFLIIVVGFIAFISAQNTQVINIQLLFWDMSLSLIILIYIIFIFGLFSGIVYGNYRTKKKLTMENTDIDDLKKA